MGKLQQCKRDHKANGGKDPSSLRYPIGQVKVTRESEVRWK